MSESDIEQTQAQTAYELGTLMGRHEAFGLIATRCSAADAATLRRIREEQLWCGHAETWNEFCETRLRMSRTQANRLIKLLEEFGDTYFMISHATRISPETYRAIAPAIRDNALHVDGEAIALTEENAARIAVAVDELRRTLVVKPTAAAGQREAEATAIEAGGEDPLEILDRRCSDLLTELARASSAVVDRAGGRAILRSILTLLQARLARLEEEIMAPREESLV